MVGRSIGATMSIDDVSLEWVPPGGLLGERPVGNEPATGVDVVLSCRMASGSRCAVLIEVKLSELDFAHAMVEPAPQTDAWTFAIRRDHLLNRPPGPQVRLRPRENAVTAHSTNYVETD